MSWGLVGFSGVIAGFLILSFYSVIAGWVLAYVFKSVSGSFVNADATAVKGLIESLSGDWVPRACGTACLCCSLL